MRRADRLFEIIQLMRRQKLVRARDLAEKLEVSERTIYRDVRDLMASRVPIEGEAGVGYALRQGFDLPPLMFDEHEIEALVLGARIVESWTDAKLAEAAGNVIAKVEAVIPERLRQHMAETALLAPARHFAEPVSVDPSALRRALRRRLRSTSTIATATTARRRARCGRSRCSSTARSGCWRGGASCARISARSGSIACRSSPCSTSPFAPSAARRSRISSQGTTQ